MGFRFSDSDQEILAVIAEHRVLTVRQLNALLRRNPSATRRRLGILRSSGFIRLSSRGFGHSRGRPESVLSLAPGSVELLKTRGSIDASVSSDDVTADKITCLEHELLVNEFRLQLALLERFLPAVSSRFFSSKSPHALAGSSAYPRTHERFHIDEGRDDWVEFTPDGVLALTHGERNKTLLFYLEVDRETEPLTSQRRPGRSIRQKIRNYQACFARNCYQRYRKALGCNLRGFRVLVLTSSQMQLVKLCRLVAQNPPSDFIWLADAETMKSQGLWAPIWARGGRGTNALQSILGTALPEPHPRPSAIM